MSGVFLLYKCDEDMKEYYTNKLHPATLGSAGIDLRANESCVIKSFERKHVWAGISMALPHNEYFIEIRGRSSLAHKYGIFGIQALIDSDYRGPLGILLWNSTTTPFEIDKGERIGQIVVMKPATQIFKFVEAEELPKTERGTGGFGSTGKF